LKRQYVRNFLNEYQVEGQGRNETCIEYVVDKFGQVINAKIVKSDSVGVDTLILRMVKEMPQILPTVDSVPVVYKTVECFSW